jgi:hypothetical protein
MSGAVPSKDRAARAEAILAKQFSQAGWHVSQADVSDDRRLDFHIRRGKHRYAVELKTGAEGRGDRLIPLWSQALLQARRLADDRHRPLAVVAAPRISESTAEQVLAFAADYAPDAPVGVFDFSGLWRFRGPGLDQMNSDRAPASDTMPSVHQEPTELFSDLNQWMLKVLLAPELPENVLSAPRGRYETISELARAADVTPMSASRFGKIFRSEGYLESVRSQLTLVRREDLLARWQMSVAARRSREVAVRPLLSGNPEQALHRVTETVDGCLGLFAAADALHMGFVRGAPAHIYVKQLNSDRLAEWTNITPVESAQGPFYLLRQAASPRSVFRAAIRLGRVLTCDALQVWLDVAGHPSRGREQADLIRRKVLAPLFQSADHG